MRFTLSPSVVFSKSDCSSSSSLLVFSGVSSNLRLLLVACNIALPLVPRLRTFSRLSNSSNSLSVSWLTIEEVTETLSSVVPNKKENGFRYYLLSLYLRN